MSESRPDAPNISRQIFESHFSTAFDQSSYERAKKIFDEVGAFNERSLAIQFHTAEALGKLDDVLSAYEKIMDPETGFLHRVPDVVTRAVEVRRFADVIYESVITDGNPMALLSARSQVEVPQIFDLMG